ncbi:Interferon-induced GTP-binding protein Mx [Paramyrothecium foliicola]|nr:Interferon-induced GTP-binding protein Mx [Paramyrothecium foliicola]
MSIQDLPSKDHRDLLDIIDQLRSEGFGRYVDLPEIIVCGDQSAGKSSVLEAISGMSFPTKDNLCTRFATELILRRDSVESLYVSITPGPERSVDEKTALSSWRPKASVRRDGLEVVIEEAKEQMGLSNTKVFCNDILRVELSGPSQPHLTMVDLPGLFRAGNKEQSEADVEIVKEMVTSYMKKPRSIILAVVSAKSDYVLQEVTLLAKQADAKGERTMGLITKPDTLDSGSESQRSWLVLVQNKDVQLRLGWHVLKNRSYGERDYTSAQRDKAEEEFFSTGIWSSLENSQCGIKSLKLRLSHILKQQILKQLPSLIEDVEEGIKSCEEKLARLGSARETPEQQQRYLIRLSLDFSTLMTDAIKGTYTNAFFGNTKHFEDYHKRLRAVVQNRLAGFAEQMRQNGENEIILDSDSDQEFSGRTISRSDYIDNVKDLMVRGKGCELSGLFNPLIVNDLFAQQCQPWKGITIELTEEILESVYKTTRCIVEHAAADEVVEGLFAFIYDRIEELKSDMGQKIQELLNPLIHSHAVTYNRQLTVNVQLAQKARNRRAIKKKIQNTFGTRPFKDVDNKIYVNPAQIVDLFLDELEPDMDRFGSALAVDYMQAYYKVAMDRFVDDVSVIAIEGCLISQLPSLLTPNLVLDLEEAEVARLVGESEETVSQRQILDEKLKTLRNGLQSIKRLYSHQSGSFIDERCSPTLDKRTSSAFVEVSDKNEETKAVSEAASEINYSHAAEPWVEEPVRAPSASGSSPRSPDVEVDTYGNSIGAGAKQWRDGLLGPESMGRNSRVFATTLSQFCITSFKVHIAKALSIRSFADHQTKFLTLDAAEVVGRVEADMSLKSLSFNYFKMVRLTFATALAFAACVMAAPSPNINSNGNLPKRMFIVPRNTTSGTINKQLPGFQNAGTGSGQQFITGQCLSDADCASGCCAGSSTGGIAECIGQAVANEPPRTGCGFTSA